MFYDGSRYVGRGHLVFFYKNSTLLIPVYNLHVDANNILMEWVTFKNEETICLELINMINFLSSLYNNSPMARKIRDGGSKKVWEFQHTLLDATVKFLNMRQYVKQTSNSGQKQFTVENLVLHQWDSF